ncbi:excitatory amino acid transporter 1-like [Onthophagus taurus]|uniref:excitatory amino acid transporter 1-like n=1 Tax=Onthophagus taurus TaxID=166361 RepID=UPI000C2046AE|nr:excitatory amino acid transporter 1-like [Onthophagus taurus]
MTDTKVSRRSSLSNGIAEFQIEETPEKNKNKCLGCLRTNLLTLLTVGGVVAGVALGFILKETSSSPWTQREIMYVNFVGDLFLRMLKSLILPLIISSLISAIANLDLSLSGRVARRAVLFYLTTTFCSVVLGIILVVSIRPGHRGGDEEHEADPNDIRNTTTVDTLLDLVRNMVPSNIVQAAIQQYRTVLIPTNSNDIYEWKVSSETIDGMNILGLVVFSALLGVALARLRDEGKPLAKFFQSLMTSMMTITTWVIWLSPVGILFLVASKILEMESLDVLLGKLGFYFITVVLGLFIQGFVVLPLLYLIMTRKNPMSFISNLGQALVTAFGTASSSATLPVAIQCLEEKSKLDPRIVRFCLPIGVTINMDGTALYEAVAAIFIAQVRGISLSIGHLIAISITATAASIGAAGIPQAGLVTMVMVLDTVGLPAEDVSLILAIDWLLDRLRTTINVMGDSFGAGIVHHLSKKDLEKLDDTIPDIPVHP